MFKHVLITCVRLKVNFLPNGLYLRQTKQEAKLSMESIFLMESLASRFVCLLPNGLYILN